MGSFRNLTFLPVIIFNTLIGIIQEIRSKKTLEKLNMLNAPHATVVRDGKTSRVNSESLVLDDSVSLKQEIRSVLMQKWYMEVYRSMNLF